MKKVIRITESQLVEIIKRTINENECKKPSGPMELDSMVKSKMGSMDYFHCISMTPQMKSKLGNRSFGYFKYDKSKNVLELLDAAGYWKVFFTGDVYADSLMKIKMGDGFGRKVPVVSENDVQVWEMKDGKICLSIQGTC
jgi:hypothetical protein